MMASMLRQGKQLVLIVVVFFLFSLATWTVFGQPFFVRGVGTNIDSGAETHWAWNDVVGWLNFYGTDTVQVTSQGLSGYASSSVGDVSLDCATTSGSPANICGTSWYQVLNDGNGALSGWAWNDAVGWISFCGGQSTTNCPGTRTHQVTVDGTTGIFSGYAWNDLVGWISFNCANPLVCGASNYWVQTSWQTDPQTGWLESATFDTGVAGGAQINSIIWQGTQPASTAVRFQLAVSNNSAGPWTYSWNTNTTTSPAVAPGTSLPVDFTLGANQRYFRYRILLFSNPAKTLSPQVDDVVVNWSR